VNNENRIAKDVEGYGDKGSRGWFNTMLPHKIINNNKNTNSVAVVRERTITTEQLPLACQASAKFCG
jgi:hypothetical protein